MTRAYLRADPGEFAKYLQREMRRGVVEEVTGAIDPSGMDDPELADVRTMKRYGSTNWWCGYSGIETDSSSESSGDCEDQIGRLGCLIGRLVGGGSGRDSSGDWLLVGMPWK